MATTDKKTILDVTAQWDDFAADADRPDYVLGRKDEEPLHITNPTGVRVMRIGEGVRRGDDAAVLMGLCGEAWPEVEKLLVKTGNKAVPAFVEALMTHFDMYEDVVLIGPSGGRVKEKLPSKIKALLNLGYKPAQGESVA